MPAKASHAADPVSSETSSTQRLVQVTKDELNKWTRGLQHRGRVSYPILKMFLEEDNFCSRLNREGMQQSTLSLSSCLSSYARNHEMPIRISMRGGELYLIRTDIDEDGNPVKQEEEKPAPKLTRAQLEARQE